MIRQNIDNCRHDSNRNQIEQQPMPYQASEYSMYMWFLFGSSVLVGCSTLKSESWRFFPLFPDCYCRSSLVHYNYIIKYQLLFSTTICSTPMYGSKSLLWFTTPRFNLYTIVCLGTIKKGRILKILVLNML